MKYVLTHITLHGTLHCMARGGGSRGRIVVDVGPELHRAIYKALGEVPFKHWLLEKTLPILDSGSWIAVQIEVKQESKDLFMESLSRRGLTIESWFRSEMENVINPPQRELF